MPTPLQPTLAELAAAIGAELRVAEARSGAAEARSGAAEGRSGADEQRIEGVAPLESAGPSQVAFYANPRYRQQLAGTRAGAVIIAESEAGQA